MTDERNIHPHEARDGARITDERKFPPHKPKRARIKRQRMALWIALGATVLLVVALVLALNFAVNRTAIEEGDSKYYILRQNGQWVMQDEEGNTLPTTEKGLYQTKSGALYYVHKTSGEWELIAGVDTGSGEDTTINLYDKKIDVLMYPILERADIKSIEVVNEKDRFVFEKDALGNFVVQGRTEVSYNTTMLATLIAVTGYTRTQMRLDLSKVERLPDGSVDYAAYGLPADGESPKNYFVITANNGTVHKVYIGSPTIPETGYYARLEGRADIYILKQMEESSYNSTLSGTLLCTLEEYVTPMFSATGGVSNYFDVTDFTLSSVNKGHIKEIVKFSYEPIELRQGTVFSTVPYIGDGVVKGFDINDYNAEECLWVLQGSKPLRTVWLDRDDTLDEVAFGNKYGLAFAIEFTYNGERAGKDEDYAPLLDAQRKQRILISDITEDGTYYVYNIMYDMVVEMDATLLRFLEWPTLQWVSKDLFRGNIGLLKDMTVSIPGGTTAGITGLTSLYFQTDGVVGPDEDGNIDTNKMTVWAQPGGQQGFMIKTEQFSKLYYVLLTSSLEKFSDTTVGEREEAIAAGPYLEITMNYAHDGGTIERVYRFYRYNGTYSFVTYNGMGEFFILRDRVDKIIGDLGLVLTDTTIEK